MFILHGVFDYVYIITKMIDIIIESVSAILMHVPFSYLCIVLISNSIGTLCPLSVKKKFIIHGIFLHAGLVILYNV